MCQFRTCDHARVGDAQLMQTRLSGPSFECSGAVCVLPLDRASQPPRANRRVVLVSSIRGEKLLQEIGDALRADDPD